VKIALRIVTGVVALVAATLGFFLWQNYDQDIEVSLRSSPETGIYIEKISSQRHELCIRSQQAIVLAHGVWPIEGTPRVFVSISGGGCLYTTTLGSVTVQLALKDQFDSEILKNGRVCVLLHFTYLNSGEDKLRLRFSCS
jgi:hypothetical protein